jgi:ATP-dependent Clp endopeptidase proteolytic subunit ClpP
MPKKSNHDNLENFLEYGIDFDNRTIYMGSHFYDDEGGDSGVDFVMADRTVKSLVALDRIAPGGDQPITIIMNNPGGDWYHGMAIYDAIKSCKNHVTIMVYGMAMSMGAVILQAADERVMAPNARFMIHYGTMGSRNTHAKIFTKWAEENEKLSTKMEDIFLEKIQQVKPNFTRKQLEKMLDYDTILSAEETIALGLADKVL